MVTHKIALKCKKWKMNIKKKNTKTKWDRRTMLSCVTFTFDFHGFGTYHFCAWNAVWFECHSRMLVISSFDNSFIVVNQTCLMSAHSRSTCAFDACILNGIFVFLFKDFVQYAMQQALKKYSNVQIKNLSDFHSYRFINNIMFIHSTFWPFLFWM